MSQVKNTCSQEPASYHVGTWHLNFQVTGAPGQVAWKVYKWGIPEKGYQYVIQECLNQVASALHSKVNVQTWFRQLRPLYSAL